MKTLFMDSKLFKFHNFEKSNLVTHIDGYDTYTCKDCGIKGKRYGLNDSIDLIRPSKVKLSNCNGLKGIFEIIEPITKKVIKTNQKIRVIDDTHLGHFYIKNGCILQVVECPSGEDENLSGVWVENRENTNFPIRLLPGEYEEIN